MAEPPSGPESHNLSGRRVSQAREQRPSLRPEEPQRPSLRPEEPQRPSLSPEEPRPPEGAPAGPQQPWGPEAGFFPDLGELPEYPTFNTLYYPQAMPPFRDELGGEEEEEGDEGYVLQQLQRDSQMFQQLEAAYQPPTSQLLNELTSLYQHDDVQYSQDTPHGPYLRDDPALGFSASELGFMPYGSEVPEPEPRELAIQNAKAYLLQTSVSGDISLCVRGAGWVGARSRVGGPQGDPLVTAGPLHPHLTVTWAA